MVTEKIPQHIKYDAAQVLSSVRALLKWLLIGCGAGVIVGCAASAFAHVLIWVNDFRAAHPMIILGLPLAGLLIVFLYRICKNSDDRGTNMVIASVHSSEHLRLRTAPLIFISTAITHLFGGSAGREGAALQLGGSIANQLGKFIKLNERDQHVIIMCGMSAGFSALFGTPLAAAIFSIEIISVGIMHYSALVPCVAASVSAHFMAQFLQVPPEVFHISPAAMNVSSFLRLVPLAACLGGVSVLFCIVLHKTEHHLEAKIKNQYVRILSAAVLVVALSMIPGNSIYLGSGMGIIEDIFHHGGNVVPYAFLLKMIFTGLTLGSGFKGGEIVPSLCIGAAFGCAAAPLFGFGPELAAACGMIGVFCGVTNCPLSSLLLSFELFGFEGMPYYLVTVAISYMLSGYCGLYRAQKIMYSKTEARFINTTTH